MTIPTFNFISCWKIPGFILILILRYKNYLHAFKFLYISTDFLILLPIFQYFQCQSFLILARLTITQVQEAMENQQRKQILCKAQTSTNININKPKIPPTYMLYFLNPSHCGKKERKTLRKNIICLPEQGCIIFHLIDVRKKHQQMCAKRNPFKDK